MSTAVGFVRRRRLGLLLVTTLIGSLTSGVMVWQGTEAAFTAQTANPGNTWTSGTVAISDNDAAAVMFSVSNMAPGRTGTKCITVLYTGSVLANVKLYALTPSDTGLASEIDLVIDVSTTAPADDTGFGADCSAGYSWSNVFTGTLASFGTGHTDFTNGWGTGWTPSSNPSRRAFRFTYTFNANSTVQGKSAGTGFQWEAQS